MLFFCEIAMVHKKLPSVLVRVMRVHLLVVSPYDVVEPGFLVHHRPYGLLFYTELLWMRWSDIRPSLTSGHVRQARLVYKIDDAIR